ncbi:MAG: hypothetical protein KIC94_14015 [Clostridiales bacterium]|nr:hypothetical protein [Clostridiales bacterium]
MKKESGMVLIIKYIIKAYFKSLLCFVVSFSVVFAILIYSELYPKLESALDLKYNSPFVMIPLVGFVCMTVVCFLIGFLMYFYKYKRNRTKGKFYKEFSAVLNSQKESKK